MTIVPIRSGMEPCPDGDPNPDVIECLQSLLDRAKAGEIIGLAYVSQHPGDFTMYGRNGRITRGTIGAIAMLQYDMCRAD
jgi:hypothetical protein